MPVNNIFQISLPQLNHVGLLISILHIFCCSGCTESSEEDTAVIARNFYVSPSGNDSNTGEIDSPLKTISYAQSKLSPGDTLFIREGIYQELVHIDNSGNKSNPIVFTAYPNEKVVIDGGNELPSHDWGALVTLSGSYIHAMGFEVRNSNVTGKFKGGEGIRLINGIHNRISFMEVHHSGDHGIEVRADYAIVEDCEVYLNAWNNIEHKETEGWANGISFAREPSNGITDHGIIRRCVVYNNHGEGIDAFEANDITIEDCVSYDNWTMNLYVSDATNCLVQRNIVYNSPTSTFPLRNDYRSGITLADEVSDGTAIPHSANNVVINNFIYNADLSAFGWTLVPNTGLTNVLIANNTIVDGGISAGSRSDEIVHENSRIMNNIIDGNIRIAENQGIFFSYNNWTVPPPAAVKGTGDIIGDPLIAFSGSSDPGSLTRDYFKLLENSPCINTGIPVTYVKEDFFSNSRNSRPDIGGYEY